MTSHASPAAAELWRPAGRLKLATGFGLGGRREVG
jgi:hypothetical protein